MTEPLGEGGPPAGADGPDAESVYDEVKRSAGEGSLGRSILLRVVGLVVLVLAGWVIARNVSWEDSLRIEAPNGATIALRGEVDGDWRGDAVGFVPDAASRTALVEFARVTEPELAGALDEALSAGRALRATTAEVSFQAGRPVARVDADVPGVLPADRIEWRAGMLRTLREIELLRLLPALGFLVLASLTVVTRWWRLLALNDCPTRWYDAFRYTYTGLFFNAVVPGINGGDVARAVAVVRDHPDRRSDALMTVVVDRAIGLVGMVVLGTALVLTTDERLDPLKLPVGLFCAALLVGIALFFSPLVRRLIRFEDLARRLPQGERLLRLDGAARRLVRHPGEVALALVLSFGNHFFNGLAVLAAASALGSELGFRDWLGTMAIANTVAAVPISPNGLGVGEVLFGTLAERLGSTYGIGVATSLLYRLTLYVMSLLGGLVMLLPGSRGRAA
ncbi:MAG: lysylphosphatidylglycerol synthase transmembrane domain-containing protein [Planctomycetota bacterium]